MARKWAAAVAVACMTVIKPAGETPLTVLAMVHLVQQVVFLRGVVNVMPSECAGEAGTAICLYKLVKKVLLTGSTRVVKLLMEQ